MVFIIWILWFCMNDYIMVVYGYNGIYICIDFFRMTGFKLLSLYTVFSSLFFIYLVLLGRREFGCLT